MTTIHQIKYIKSLNQKKFRQKYDKFVVEGDKICQDLLRKDKYEIDIIYALKQWFSEHGEILKKTNILSHEVSERELQKISNFKTANQAFSIISIPNSNIFLTKSHRNIIFLDGIQDPGNLGTIIRIADWFGFKSIVASQSTVDFYNPKVVQATMGSFMNVCLVNAELQELKNLHPDRLVLAASLEGKSIYDNKISSPSILVIGNESKGISKSVLKLVDKEIRIPSYGNRSDSLNAAISTAIICAEIRRK